MVLSMSFVITYMLGLKENCHVRYHSFLTRVCA